MLQKTIPLEVRIEDQPTGTAGTHTAQFFPMHVTQPICASGLVGLPTGGSETAHRQQRSRHRWQTRLPTGGHYLPDKYVLEN